MEGIRARIGELINQSPLRQMAFSAFTTASVTMVAKIVGFVKEIVVAAYFGLSGGLDVYFMAFVLIGFPVSILMNAIQNMLITILSGGRQGQDENGRLYTSTIVLSLLALVIVLPFWLWFLHFSLPWLASGFSGEKLAWLESAIYFLVPYYFINSLNLLGYGALQARKKYVVNGTLPTITPVVTIIFVVLYSHSSAWQILVVSLVVGTAIECFVINILQYREGGFIWPRLFGNPELIKLSRGSLILSVGTFLLAISPLVEQAMAASLGEGTNAALGYGFRIPAALNGILVAAIGITALPYFSSLLADGKMEYCLHSLDKISRWLLMTGLPLAIVLALMSEPIISLFYQRGAFDASSVQRVSPIQQAYFIQLPFLLIVMLCTKILVALNKHAVMSMLSAGTVIAHAGLVWWLGSTRGASGIAWGVTTATVLTSIAAFLLSRSYLAQKL